MCGSFETGQWACGKSLQKYDIIFRTLRGYCWCCDTIHPECRGETLRRTVSWFVTNLAPALIIHFCLLLILSFHVLSHVSMPVLSGWICHFLKKKTSPKTPPPPPKKKNIGKSYQPQRKNPVKTALKNHGNSHLQLWLGSSVTINSCLEKSIAGSRRNWRSLEM